MEISSIISILFILQAIINGFTFTIAQSPSTKERYVCRGGDFESTTIQKNRDYALGKILALLRNSSYHGFHHTQVGDKIEEQVSASVLCPPTVHVDLCKCCFKNLVPYLLKNCPKQKEGVAWDSYPYVNCMARYSVGRKIFSVLDDWAWYHFAYPNYVKAIDLEKTMDSLAIKLKEQAARGDAFKKYAQGRMNYDGEEHVLYVALQCTPDLTKEDCVKCLSKASDGIRSSCTSKKLFSGRVFSTNCYIWYSHITMFDPPLKFDREECG